jgi:D-cysteine desulfhydrase
MNRPSYPDRIRFANLPTPLQRLERLSMRFGVDLRVKRDDMTGTALSGNKIRKLEFSLAAAQTGKRGCDSHLRRRAVEPLPGRPPSPPHVSD